MTSFHTLPSELVAEILDLVIHSSRESLTSFRSTPDPIRYLQPISISGHKTTTISLLRRVCFLWDEIVRERVLPPMYMGNYLHSIGSGLPQRDDHLLDLCIATSDDAWELALDEVFTSSAPSQLRSIFLRDVSRKRELLALFEAIISSEAVDLPLLQRIEIQFDKVGNIDDYRQTEAIDALALALSQVPTLTELYWHSANFISPHIPWAQLKIIHLHQRFSSRTVVTCMEMCTSATRIGIEGIDAWQDACDVNRERSTSFVHLPELEHLTLTGMGNIFGILDDLSLPKIGSVEIILSYPVAGRRARISAAASLQRFMHRHRRPMSITIKVEAGQASTAEPCCSEYATASWVRRQLEAKDLARNEEVQTLYPSALVTSSQRKPPKEIRDFLAALIAEVGTFNEIAN